MALFALVHPEIFHEWRLYDVRFSSDISAGVVDNSSSTQEARLKMKLLSATEESVPSSVNHTDTMAPSHWVGSGTDSVRHIESSRATRPLALNESAIIENLLAYLFRPSRPDDVTSCPINDVEWVEEPRLTFLVSLGLLPHLITGLFLLLVLCFWSYMLASKLLERPGPKR